MEPLPAPVDPTEETLARLRTNLKNMQHFNDQLYTNTIAKTANAFLLFSRSDSGDPGMSIGINLLCDEKGGNGFPVAYGAGKKTLTVDYVNPPFELREGEDLTLRIFIDKSMIEVFANDRQAVVAWHEYDPANLGVSLFSTGGDLFVKKVTAWKMKSIYR